jgi:hypothetical protein
LLAQLTPLKDALVPLFALTQLLLSFKLKIHAQTAMLLVEATDAIAPPTPPYAPNSFKFKLTAHPAMLLVEAKDAIAPPTPPNAPYANPAILLAQLTPLKDAKQTPPLCAHNPDHSEA